MSYVQAVDAPERNNGQIKLHDPAAALREAAGHACESINELLTLLKFYEPPGKVATKAEERLARLRALGAIR